MDANQMPDGLAIFHAKFRLRFGDDLKLKYDCPNKVGSCLVDVFAADNRYIAALEYRDGHETPYGFSDASHDVDFAPVSERVTSDVDELLNWIESVLS